jgi:hypothetical protein
MPDINHEHPFPGNVLLRVDKMDDYDDETRTPVSHPDDANVVSSICTTGLDHAFTVAERHRPVLDIDFPCAVVPSTTPGHFHLYLDKELTWPQYRKVLEVLGEVGILEPGYVNVSVERKHTAVRVPWIRKGQDALGSYAGRAREALVNLALDPIRRRV